MFSFMDFHYKELWGGTNNNNNWIIPLFTLGSIYSTNASGAEQMAETNNSNWT